LFITKSLALLPFRSNQAKENEEKLAALKKREERQKEEAERKREEQQRVRQAEERRRKEEEDKRARAEEDKRARSVKRPLIIKSILFISLMQPFYFPLF